MSELSALCEKYRVRIECKFLGETRKEGWDQQVRAFTVTLRFWRRRLTVPFFQGMGHTSEPTAADVIACLVSDASTVESSGDFEGFCSELGYESDSRKVEALWKELKRQAPRVRRFLGDHFAEFQGAEHRLLTETTPRP